MNSIGSITLHSRACAARDRAYAAVKACPDTVVWDSVDAVILSVIAAEAFVNELENCSPLPAPEDSDDFRRLTSLTRLLKEAEEGNGRLTLKYQLAAQALSGETFDPGRNPLQDFEILIKVRNLLVHFRPLNKIRYEQGRFSNTYPSVVKGLQQRGLARQLPEACVTDWTAILLTEKLAAWACDTSWNMIRVVIDMLPGLPGTAYGVIFNPEQPFGARYSPANPRRVRTF